MQAIVYKVNPLGWVTCKWLRHFWKGCLCSRINGLALREVAPPPLPGDDWVRVRTLLGGICGTDLSLVAQKQRPDSILQAFGSMPMGLGHENVAVVTEVGKAAEASWLGRRVCVEPTLGCTARGIEPACPRCAAGEFGACENFGANGVGRYGLPAGTSIGYNRATGGSMGESFVAHQSQLVPVPDALSDEQAVLTDPLACSLHSVLRANLSGAQRVLVYGAGVLGLGAIAAMRAVGFGGHIDALDYSGYLEKIARRLGANDFVRLPLERGERFAAIAARTGGTVHRVRFNNYMLCGGYDVVFECVGSPQSMAESLKWTRARGDVVVVGTGSGGNIDLTPIWFRELNVKGAYGRQFEHFAGGRISTYALVHRLMTEGKLDVAGMLTHKFRLKDYRQAFDVSLHKGRHQAIKVALDVRP